MMVTSVRKATGSVTRVRNRLGLRLSTPDNLLSFAQRELRAGRGAAAGFPSLARYPETSP